MYLVLYSQNLKVGYIQPEIFTTNSQMPSGFSMALQPLDFEYMLQNEISPGH